MQLCYWGPAGRKFSFCWRESSGFPVSVVVRFFSTSYELGQKQTLTSGKRVPRRGKRGRVLLLVKEEGEELEDFFFFEC